jgi:hypothetical protein
MTTIARQGRPTSSTKTALATPLNPPTSAVYHEFKYLPVIYADQKVSYDGLLVTLFGGESTVQEIDLSVDA